MKKNSNVVSNQAKPLAGLAHIGFVAPDMDKAIQQWEAQGIELIVPPSTDMIQNVICCLLMMSGNIPIELISPVTLDDSRHPLMARLARGGGLDHLCVYCDELSSKIAQLEATGGRLISGPVYGSVFDRNIAFMYMPTGLIIELMQSEACGWAVTDPLNPLIEKYV